MIADLSDGQEWLYDRIVEELEWRRWAALKAREPYCSCWLCFSPFPLRD